MSLLPFNFTISNKIPCYGCQRNNIESCVQWLILIQLECKVCWPIDVLYSATHVFSKTPSPFVLCELGEVSPFMQTSSAVTPS